MAVIETEQEKQFRRELEAAGEQAVRDDLNFRRGISTGGETKLQCVMRWLREKEREREARAGQSDWYVRWTFWVVVVTLVVAFAGVIATVYHP
jgi:hypothetical protein